MGCFHVEPAKCYGLKAIMLRIERIAHTSRQDIEDHECVKGLCMEVVLLIIAILTPSDT